MNKDLFRPFGDNFSATADDFRASDSYRWVRYGTVLLLLGYLIISPAMAFFAYQRAVLKVEDISQFDVVLLIATSLALLSVAGGCCLLAFSPLASEKRAAKKFLIAYAIAIACLILSRTMNNDHLDLVRRAAQAYGLYYLIAYFQVLGVNRDNPRLLSAANLTNKVFIGLILLVLLFLFFNSQLGLPIFFSIALLALGSLFIYVVWLKTLWHAYQATRPIERDFSV